MIKLASAPIYAVFVIYKHSVGIGLRPDNRLGSKEGLVLSARISGVAPPLAAPFITKMHQLSMNP